MGTHREQTVYSEREIEKGRLLFSQKCEFIFGATILSQIPNMQLPEIAFSGRSNVGKSSLINALTGQNALARTSNTPGRTQQLNFFDLGKQLTLVDLPGYGYARASKIKVAGWTKTLRSFLRGRAVLRRVCLLIDARHGLKETDRDMMKLLDETAVVYQVVLTKIDKINSNQLEECSREVFREIKIRPAAHPIIELTSSSKFIGIENLRAEIAKLVAQ